MTFATSVTGILTAAGSLLTGVAVLITAWRLLLPLLRSTREVHVMVNQQRTDMQRYQRALVAALQAAGVDVPADQAAGD